MSFLRWIYRYVVQVALATAAIVGAYHLTQRVGPYQAMAIAGAVAVVASLLASLLVRLSPVGRVTWLNHTASYLMPWGARFGLGSLWQFAAGSAVMWVLLALTGTLLAIAPGGTPTWAIVMLGACWLILGVGMAFVAGSIVQRRESLLSRANRSMLTVLGVILAVFAASSASLYAALPITAVVIAAAPIVVVGVPFIAFISLILARGKNMRWH